MKGHLWKIGAMFTVISLIGLLIINFRLINSKVHIKFQAEAEILKGTYYPGDQDAGIILLEGFGSDQTTMQSMANAFVRRGVHVMTFDFSGHGYSPGGITFDNAQTDRMALQTQAALQKFQELSGLPTEKIILLGHSLGARVALQSAVIAALDLSGLILLGPQVNLISNAQSEFFTGVQDIDLDWVQDLSPQTPNVDILILSGTWEDIFTVKSGEVFMQKMTVLSGVSQNPASGLPAGNSSREWVLIPNLLHNFEPFSPEVVTSASQWAADQWGIPPGRNLLPVSILRVIFWITSYLGLFMFVIGLLIQSEKAVLPSVYDINIDQQKKFILAKLWLWLPAIPFLLLIGSFIFFFPLPTPLFNIIYVAFIGGYGSLMLILYVRGKTPGTRGQIQTQNEFRIDQTNLSKAAAFNLFLFLGLIFLVRSGWYSVPPLGDRFWWLIIFTLLTLPGFWVSQLENLMLEKQKKNISARFLVGIIGFLPFFLYTGALALLGSISGVISGLIGLSLIGLVSMQGFLNTRWLGSALYSAVLQSVLLYLIILPQGVLFV